MRKLLLAGTALTMSLVAAWAQSSPGFTPGQVPTAGQWNGYFSAKQDYLGAAPILTTGGILSGKLTTASASVQAGFNLTPGSTPTTPINGDVWLTSSGLFAQINGATVQVGGTSSPTLAIGSNVGLSTSGCSPIAGTCTLSATTDTPQWTGLGLGGAAPATGLEVYNTAVALTANGQGVFGASTTLGGVLGGQGSSNDFTLENKGGSTVCNIATGTTTLTCAGLSVTTGGSLAGTFSGTPTLSGANFITLANIVQDATAWSLLGNASASTANYAPFTLASLTNKASLSGAELVLISDAGQLKNATVSAVAAGATVSSIDSKTGAFTTGNGLDSTAGNVIELTAARRTLPTTQLLTSGSGATYTTPANALWLEVYIVGSGGGGAGCGSSGQTNGSAGNTTTFNSINAAGGALGTASSGSSGTPVSGGAGGTGGTGSAIIRWSGSAGGPGNGQVTSSLIGSGGDGGASGLGFGGAGKAGTGATGGTGGSYGGGGAGCAGSATSVNGSSGGGGGEVAYLIINNPSASYTYTIGAGGAAGSSGTNGFGGGAGGPGVVLVIEHYN